MRTKSDQFWMSTAIELAKQAGERGEIPVGAVLILDDKIIGRGRNQSIEFNDPTAHAEIQALREAGSKIGNYRLSGSKMYVTIEPCTMCFGALIHARVARVFYATEEQRAGVLVSQLQLANADFYNHQIQVAGGLLADESAVLLRQFFRSRRATNRMASE